MFKWRSEKKPAQNAGGTGNGTPPSDDDVARGSLADQLEKIEWLASMFFGAVLFAILLYAFAGCVRVSFAASDSVWSSIGSFVGFFFFNFGVLFALAVTAAVVGGLLGFLFGIPRAMQGNAVAVPVMASTDPPSVGGGVAPDELAKSRAAAQSGRAFAGNSNLEEISDWLTKIIVGVGLVQASTIYTKMFSLADWFKKTIVCPQTVAGACDQGADVMFLLILISGLIGGFLFLYLETRTRVMQLFTDTEAVIAPKSKALAAPALRTALQAPIGSGRGQGQANVPSTSEDEKLLKIPYESLKTGDELAAWASAQARAGNLQAANQALRAAIANEPENKDYLVRLADVLERQGSPEAAKALIAEARQKQGDDLALLKRNLVQALYQVQPDGFESALQTTQQLLARPDGAKDPFVHAWTAAAYGQKYSWLVRTGGSDADKQAARANALAAARKVFELTSDPRSAARALVRGMLDPSKPGAAPEDNDLEVFKDDPEFQTVVNAGMGAGE